MLLPFFLKKILPPIFEGRKTELFYKENWEGKGKGVGSLFLECGLGHNLFPPTNIASWLSLKFRLLLFFN